MAAPSPAREKVQSIFRELVGDRAERLVASRPTVEALARLSTAIEGSPDAAADIAFHMADWNADAAFVVAVHLFPERFTDEEIRDGVRSFLIHAPNHVAAAAKLGGWPISDVFGVGPLTEE
jgi:hypothetical protein